MEIGPFGLSEVIFIALLALIVFGPRRLPEIGHAVGRMTARLRRATNDLKRSWEAELDEESRQSMRDAADQLRRVRDELSAAGREAWAEGAAATHAARDAAREAGRTVDASVAAVLPRTRVPPAMADVPARVAPSSEALAPPTSSPAPSETDAAGRDGAVPPTGAPASAGERADAD